MELKLNRQGRRYGAFPSPPKASDLGFPSHLIVRSGEFPVRAFLTGKIGDVKDQGQQGSCTAHGSTSLGERLYRRWKGVAPQFSPAYTYYQERSLEGNLGNGDTGANVDSSLIVADPKAFKQGGWCDESVMPYNDSTAALDVAPSAAALASAALNPGGAYHSLGNNIANIKSCILSDYSFVIGISVYDSFESDEAAASGIIPYPNVNTESIQGGHETHAGIGFDDTVECPNAPNPGAVLCQNSWGTSWGAEYAAAGTRGFYWLSYDFLLNPQFTSDIRMGHLGKAW